MFKKHRQKQNGEAAVDNHNNSSLAPPPVSPITKNSLQFHCQLAHGSPTVFVSNFTSVRELYQKIAEAFDMSPSEV
ncbi:unnamed protein product, partial [Callosobruchus maculatus]